MSDETPLRNISIKQWAEDDRPREKLLTKGRQAMSDAELIALLIATGTREESAVDVAKRILLLAQNNLNALGRLTLKELQQIKGIGEAKAITLAAALELGRRRTTAEAPEQRQIKSSRDSYAVLAPMLADLPNEVFAVLLLNRNNRVIAHKRISEGGVSGTVVDPKLIFRYALDHLASALVLCHNHPSGNLQPSEADRKLTQQLHEAGRLLDIVVLDHLILAGTSYFSFSDEGLL